MITSLPIDLLLYMLDFIDNDQEASKSFGSVNKNFFTFLYRKILKIEIMAKQLLQNNKLGKENILNRIDNHMRQLILVDNLPSPFCVDVRRAYFIRSKRVEFVSQLEKVHIFQIYKASQGQLKNLLFLLSEKVQHTSFTVKELTIVEGNDLEEINILEGLEVIQLCDFPKLKSLNLHDYKSLRRICLSLCKGVEDVSSLDGIYDLELHHCHNLKDISCLNNNHRITIDWCRGIIDYSKSFKHSRYISLEDVGMDSLPSFPAVVSLSLRAVKLQNPPKTFILPNYLKFLSLRLIDGIESIGPNKLQKVSLSACNDFKSLDNMSTIRTVELEALELISLSGLGANNKIVRLREMKSLQDISALKDSERVEIVDCKSVENFNTLQSVKEFSLLLKDDCPLQILSTCGFNGMYLQVLEVSYPYSSGDVDDIKNVVKTYQNIQKLSIHIRINKIIQIFDEDIMKDFIIEKREKNHQIVLLRRKMNSN